MNPSEEIRQLKESIEACNKAYYEDDNPIMSDAAYDTMTRRLRELEQQHPELLSPDSPSQHVGGKANRKPVKHIAPLLSLRDVFDKEEVSDWYHSSCNMAETSSAGVTVEDKVDGLSLAVTYYGGRLVAAATRGDGHTGEDVTANAMMVRDIPHVLPTSCPADSTVIVRCEVYLPTTEFHRINKELELTGKPLFKNPRNAAAGTLRANDPALVQKRGLRAAAFQVLYTSGVPLRITQETDLKWLQDNDFYVVSYYYCNGASPLYRMEQGVAHPMHVPGTRLNLRNGVQAQISAAIQDIDLRRNTKPYPIDGAVVKLNNMNYYPTLGQTDKYPRWAVAYKYPPEQKQTILREVRFQTGRTGVITPVAIFDPVQLAGTTVTKATLHNMNYIQRNLNGVAIGDTILVHKSGEIIPEVLAVVTRRGANPVTLTACPVCGAHVAVRKSNKGEETVHVCTNPNCPAVLEQHLTYWCSKHIMDMDGVGPKTIQTLLQFKLVSSIPDLYTVTEEQFIRLFGNIAGANIYASVQSSKQQNIDRLIAGLGIPGVGRTIGTLLAKTYPDMDAVSQAAMTSELSSLNGIGTVTASELRIFFSSDTGRNMLTALKKQGVNMTSQTYQQQGVSTLPFSGLTFVITGTIENMSREEVTDYIETNGGKVTSSVSKKTSYLVAGDEPGSKLKKAESMGIPVINIKQLQGLKQSQKQK